MANNRPNSRPRGENTTGGGIHKRGDGLNLGGPAGNVNNNHKSAGASMVTRAGGGMGALGVIALLVYYMLGGGGTSTQPTVQTNPVVTTPVTQTVQHKPQQSKPQTNTSYGVTNTGYTQASSESVDTSVKKGVRDKFTKIKGNGKDEVTVLVYMCATDLEANYGAASGDINEMAYATQSDKVNVILQTGGTKRWKNTVMDSNNAQRWKVGPKSLIPLNQKMGQLNMVEPDNLADFIKWGVANYPANRYMLILWDHGGGSVTGYGYDMNYPNGSMSVDEIAGALKAAGTKFDFIGFDACLMANVETAVAVAPYADYLIASEETEPGAGWYYTGWLSTLAKNTSTDTLTIGKQIVDEFVADNNKQRQQLTSLSVVDLGEFDHEIPNKLKDFAKSLNNSITSDEFVSVSKARGGTKEYAQSNSIDQIDLVHFCNNIGTKEAQALAKAIQSCVKYNVTKNMSNSYGLSIYFPYKKVNKVNTVTGIYEKIGMDETYTSAIRSYAQHSGAGQVYTNNTSNSLINVLGGNQVSNGQSLDSTALLNLLMGGGSAAPSSSYSGYSSGGYGNLFGGSSADMLSLLANSLVSGRAMLDSDSLVYTELNGQKVLALSDSDWKLVNTIGLNVWIDDGEGYIDLGVDNVFDFDDDGNLIANYDGYWLAIDGNPIAYYYLSDEYLSDDDYTVTGYSPAMLNGEQVMLIIEFSDEHPDGVVLGAQKVYETETETKGLIEIVPGDQIDFICDYYTYNGEFDNNYYLGESYTADDELTVSNYEIRGEKGVFTYRLVDIYGSERLTPALDFATE